MIKIELTEDQAEMINMAIWLYKEALTDVVDEDKPSLSPETLWDYQQRLGVMEDILMIISRGKETLEMEEVSSIEG